MNTPDPEQIFNAEKVLKLSNLSEYSLEDISRIRAEVARNNHPDLAKSPGEKARREKLLTDVNQSAALLQSLFSEGASTKRQPIHEDDFAQQSSTAASSTEGQQSQPRNQQSRNERQGSGTTAQGAGEKPNAQNAPSRPVTSSWGVGDILVDGIGHILTGLASIGRFIFGFVFGLATGIVPMGVASIIFNIFGNKAADTVIFFLYLGYALVCAILWAKDA